jgi:hypothetical protein
MLNPDWHKSSYSNQQSSCVEVKSMWRKSSCSNGQSNCVEVRTGQPDAVAVRDSKDRGGPELAFMPNVWAGFVLGVKRGEFDLV